MHLTAHALRAMALQRLDRRIEARLALDSAKAIPLTKEDAPDFLIGWNDHLVARLIRREAEAIIAPGKK